MSTLKTILLVGVLCTLGGLAHAGITCGRALVDVGKTGRNGVVETTVAIDDHVWTVKHTLADGTVIDRSLQYMMVDKSTEDKSQWRGSLLVNPKLYMVGEIMRHRSTDQPVYNEWVFDRSKGDLLIMHSMSLCKYTPGTQPGVGDDVQMPTF
jgi:hypothetical protein